MTSKDDLAATSMAILSAFIHGDREGLAIVTEDMPCEQVLALLARASEVVVNLLAQTLEVTKLEALALAAQAVASVDQD